MSKSDALARLMERRVQLRLSPDATAAWTARRGLERLLSVWPAAYLACLADSEDLCLVIAPGDTGFALADSASGCRLTLSIDPGQLAGPGDAACDAGAALATAILARCGLQADPRAALVLAEFERRLATAHGLSYAAPEAALQSPRSYLIWACSRYLRDSKALAGEDPQAYRLLHSTLFADTFWRSLASACTGATDRG
ncbi:MAG: hypothetical protein ACYC5O_01335 [Anaerolineae bacterium]